MAEIRFTKLEDYDVDKFHWERFWLPVAMVHHFDPPGSHTRGDSGWSITKLKTEIRVKGQLEALQVGRSIVDMEEDAGRAAFVYAYNGNHRLFVCKKLKIPFVLCENSYGGSEDAFPLTAGEIVALGGTLQAPAAPEMSGTQRASCQQALKP